MACKRQRDDAARYPTEDDRIMTMSMRLCEEHRLGGLTHDKPDECAGCALEAAMRALARHDGRSWCAVCGSINYDCDRKTPECLGSRARRLFPRETMPASV